MEVVAIVGVLFQFGFFALCGVALIYFLLKRIKDKKNEQFEQRDN